VERSTAVGWPVTADGFPTATITCSTKGSDLPKSS